MLQSAALYCLGLKIPGRIKRRVEVWFSDEQRQAISRGMTEESEQLLGMVRRAAGSHEEQLYMLRQARYPEARAEGIRRREAELEAPLLGLWLGLLHQGGFQVIISLIVLPILVLRTSRGLCRNKISFWVATINLVLL